jgi:peptide/nickel transport system ATP-binding protein
VTLAAVGVSVDYRAGRRTRVPALRDVDLSIAPGETVGLIGSSGSGKSTLLRVLLALERPTRGEVRLDGVVVRGGGHRRMRPFRRHVQYVPQEPGGSLDPRMSVEQLVTDPLRRLRVEGPHPARARAALDAVHLSSALLPRRPAELSGGQAQRVAIARAIATGSPILLADEPVSGLDLPLRDQVLELLAELVAVRGIGVVFASHDLDAVARLCRRGVVMAKGRVVESGPPQALLEQPSDAATRALVDALPRLPGRAARS